MSNPIMKLDEKRAESERVINTGEIMTVNGALQITGFMGLLLVFAAGFVWQKFAVGHTDLATMLTFGGAIVGFISALIIAFARVTVLIPLYAVCEGLFLGGISLFLKLLIRGLSLKLLRELQLL